MKNIKKIKEVFDKIFGEWHIGDKFTLGAKIYYEIEDIDYSHDLVYVKTKRGEHFNLKIYLLRYARKES